MDYRTFGLIFIIAGAVMLAAAVFCFFKFKIYKHLRRTSKREKEEKRILEETLAASASDAHAGVLERPDEDEEGLEETQMLEGYEDEFGEEDTGLLEEYDENRQRKTHGRFKVTDNTQLIHKKASEEE